MEFHVSIDTVILLIVAAMNAYTAWRTRQVEKNTNSMKDALVSSTAKASLAEGHAAGLEQGRDEKHK
jgi:hypothetical protein